MDKSEWKAGATGRPSSPFLQVFGLCRPLTDRMRLPHWEGPSALQTNTPRTMRCLDAPWPIS